MTDTPLGTEMSVEQYLDGKSPNEVAQFNGALEYMKALVTMLAALEGIEPTAQGMVEDMDRDIPRPEVAESYARERARWEAVVQAAEFARSVFKRSTLHHAPTATATHN